MIHENSSMRSKFSPLDNITVYSLDSESVHSLFNIRHIENKAINDRVCYGEEKILTYFLILGYKSSMANIEFELTSYS